MKIHPSILIHVVVIVESSKSQKFTIIREELILKGKIVFTVFYNKLYFKVVSHILQFPTYIFDIRTVGQNTKIDTI